MGEDVYLVAFLMSVEMQRLREDNDKLWGDKEAVESKMRALAIVESELKESRQKMGEYEKRIALVTNEMEQWKQKYTSK